MRQQKKQKSTKHGLVVAARLDTEFVKTLNALAESDRRPLSNMIDVLLREAVAARKIKI